MSTKSQHHRTYRTWRKKLFVDRVCKNSQTKAHFTHFLLYEKTLFSKSEWLAYALVLHLDIGEKNSNNKISNFDDHSKFLEEIVLVLLMGRR
jgi:hypothetical protein